MQWRSVSVYSQIRNEIEYTVYNGTANVAQRDGVLFVLHRQGFPLAPDAPCLMGTLSSLAYAATGGRDEAVQAGGGAVVELLMAASYTLDHVMDEEIPPDSTVGIETAHGTSLILLAESALDRAAHRAIPPSEHATLSREIRALILHSAAAQTEELELIRNGTPRDFSTDDALALTKRKAGSLGRIAGVIGTRLAGAGASAVQLMADCFESFTTSRQLIDDLSDAADTPAGGQKSDAARGKPTLPLVYLRNAAAQGMGEAAGGIGTASMASGKENLTIEQLHSSGAYTFTAVIAEMFRNQALETLRTSYRAGPGRQLEALSTLDEILSHGPPEAGRE